MFTKYFITEGVIANSLNKAYYPVVCNSNLTTFMKSITNELILNRQEFSQIYEKFSSNKLSKEYKNFISNNNITIITLNAKVSKNITLLFSSAMMRIPAAITSLINQPNLIETSNRDTYELMQNLLNEYYINWQKVINILMNDFQKLSNFKTPLLIIILFYLLFFVIAVIIFIKLLAKFSLDREKPINLFLTLKKQVFETLKVSAENFSNKLLNKFFGNEETEEESQQDYQENIQPNDINIIKFKAANEYNYSIKKGLSFPIAILIISTFHTVNAIFFIFHYFDFKSKLSNIRHLTF